MGTRYEDQPPEHWAGPESLDPTPVWKQYLLVAAFSLLAIVLVAAVAYASLAVQLATPPAVVPGGRVVLARSDVPAVGEEPRLFGPALVDEARAFYLWQPTRGNVVALKASSIGPLPSPVGSTRIFVQLDALDRYLVSVEGDRVVVNISRVIRGVQRTEAPHATPAR